MKSQEIQQVIMSDYYGRGHSPIITNFAGCGLHECDVATVSKARVLYEFEIKISRSDFKADAKKTIKHKWLAMRNGGKNKDYFNIPNHFYYVVTKDLIKIEEVPEYAGLIYVDKETKLLKMIKKAPKLHDKKVTDKMIEAMARNITAKLVFGCSYKNWQVKQDKLIKEQKAFCDSCPQRNIK
jgi:hypothetical protein